MVPRLVEGMKSVAKPKQYDESIPYKDAAFALLTHQGGALLPSRPDREQCRRALVAWLGADFDRRLAESDQIYGVDQLVRELGAEGAKPLPALIGAKSEQFDRIAQFVADHGDEPTRQRASRQIVELARYVGGKAWIEAQRPEVAFHNKAAKIDPKPAEFQAQLEEYQSKELVRVFAASKRLGGQPVVDYLLTVARDAKNPPERQAAALAALRGNIAAKDSAARDQLLKMMSSDATPDVVKHQAVRRLGELPRDQVAEGLYRLFDTDQWKVGWVAAEQLLKMSKAQDVGEFMEKISKVKHLALSEPLVYGPVIGEMKGGQELLDRYAEPNHPVAARLTALGYYYRRGSSGDLAKVAAYANDDTQVPKCPTDAQDCAWECTIGNEGQEELKQIRTLGQYVEYCIKPAMEKRKPKKVEKEQSGK
jgi:hypothetical protein